MHYAAVFYKVLLTFDEFFCRNVKCANFFLSLFSFQTTKGRNWTVAEKEKAMKFKKMCSHRCYNFVRKNLVPLPCTWELNTSGAVSTSEKRKQVKTEYSTETTEEEESKKILVWQDHLKTAEMIEVQNIEENQIQTVHHIVVPPEVWADGHQKIEFIVQDNEMTQVSVSQS